MEKTVCKAFALLELLAVDRTPQRMTDIAARAGLTKANVHRLLTTLRELGYVAKDEATGRFGATLKLWELGCMLVADADLQSAAGDVLRRLCETCGESVALGLLDEGSIVYVAKVDGPMPIRAVAQLGSRRPATATALGKAILAWRPPEALDQAMPHAGRLTPLTLTSRRDIERDLEATRERGYAVSRGESVEGICGIGAPIFDAAAWPIAGVCIWGAEQDILGSRREALAGHVMRAALDISRRLGHVAPPGGVPAVRPEASSASAARAPRRVRRPSASPRARRAAAA